MASNLAHRHPHNTANVAAFTESRLLRNGPFDARQELDSSLLESYTNLQSQLTSSFQACTHSDADLLQLNQALIYGILTQQQAQQSLITHLAAVTRDGYACFVSILLRLVHECYLKLLEQPRRHLLWLVRQLLNFSASDTDTLCLSLLRRIVGGDVSQWNVWLAGQMLDILSSNWLWFVRHSGLLTGALFTFLRLLPDHFMAKTPDVNELKQNEAAFCVKILRERFQDCLVIGRDLVRLLQDVACIPEFESVWRDLLSNPSAFNTVGFTDIAQLYVVRTPSRYLTSRVTPEMEAQIRFMLTHVRMGNQQRYQSWFAQRFFAVPGSETLVCDIVRFICCAHHPTNQILQSDVLPRWAMLGWLLTCCKSRHVEANAKLALFFDWLFYMNKTDNLMNIEPALLLMLYSVPKYMDITHSLLEFLFLCIENYDPLRKDMILCGVTAAVDILIEKKVVPSLKPLATSPHVVYGLKKKLIEYFPMYCQAEWDNLNERKQEAKNISSIGLMPGYGVQTLAPKKTDTSPMSGVKGDLEQSVGDSDKAAAPGLASKDERGCSAVLSPDKDKRGSSLCVKGNMSQEKNDHDILVDGFSEILGRPQEEAADVFGKLLMSRVSEFDKVAARRAEYKEVGDEHHAESIECFAKKVSGTLKEGGYNLFTPLIGHLSDSFGNDEIMSLTSAVFRTYIHFSHPLLLQMLLFWHSEGFAVSARLLCYACRLAEAASPTYISIDSHPEEPDVQSRANQDEELGQPPLKRRKMSKLSALSWHQKYHGSVLELAQIYVHPAVAESFKAYTGFLKGVKNKGDFYVGASPVDQSKSVNDTQKKESRIDEGGDDLDTVFLQDLETCLTWSRRKLLSILSLVFNHLPDLSRGKVQVIKLLVSVVDPVELCDFELKVSLKELSVFGPQPRNIANVVKGSLSWDCIEQQYLWRLLLSELQNTTSLCVSDFVVTCASFLDPARHCEGISGLLSLLRMQRPTSHLILTMLHLPQGFGMVVAAVFAAWMSLEPSRFSGCLAAVAIDILQPTKESIMNPEPPLQSLVSLNNSALKTFSSFLDRCPEMRQLVDEKEKSEIDQLRETIRQLAEQPRLNTATDASWANSAEM